jgi:hypothetical protein
VGKIISKVLKKGKAILKESVAQIFTLLGFFIAWLTLTGSAKDVVGIAILFSIAVWLLTINWRE